MQRFIIVNTCSFFLSAPSSSRFVSLHLQVQYYIHSLCTQSFSLNASHYLSQTHTQTRTHAISFSDCLDMAFLIAFPFTIRFFFRLIFSWSPLSTFSITALVFSSLPCLHFSFEYFSFQSNPHFWFYILVYILLSMHCISYVWSSFYILFLIL